MNDTQKTTKFCHRCKTELPVASYYKNVRGWDGLGVWCKTCTKAYKIEHYNKNKAASHARGKRWALANPEKTKSYYRKSRRNLRDRVLSALGNKCACCGESRYEFLSVDHINNDGAKHRKSVKSCIYWDIEKQGYPKEKFQILCHNCNFSKGAYGECPHVRERREQSHAI